VIALRSDHEIDNGSAGENLLPFGLRHASRHRDHGVETAGVPLPLHRPRPSKLGIDFLGGLLTDVAGIENDEVRRSHVGGSLVAVDPKRFCHALGVIGVHLTAEGLDVELFGGSRHRLLVPYPGASRQDPLAKRPSAFRTPGVAWRGRIDPLPIPISPQSLMAVGCFQLGEGLYTRLNI
jgi:hypothetical protein